MNIYISNLLIAIIWILKTTFSPKTKNSQNKKVYYPKFKKIGRISKNNSKILDYLTFLKLGVLKNIILRLKNNIEIVRAGKI